MSPLSCFPLLQTLLLRHISTRKDKIVTYQVQQHAEGEVKKEAGPVPDEVVTEVPEAEAATEVPVDDEADTAEGEPGDAPNV